MNKQEKMTALLNYMSERSISVADAMQFLQPLQESAASKVSLKPPPKAPVQSPESSLPARMESPKDGQHLKKVIITLDSVPRTFMCAMTSRKAGICPVCEVENSNLARHLVSCAKRNNLGEAESPDSTETSAEIVEPAGSARKSAKSVVQRTEISWVSAGRWTFLRTAMQQRLLSEKTIETYLSKLDQYNQFILGMLESSNTYATLEQLFTLQFLEKFERRMESLNHSASSFVNIFVALGSLWNLVKLKGHEPALFPTELGIRASFPGSAVYQKIAAGMAAIQQMQKARGKQKREQRLSRIETVQTMQEKRLLLPMKELFDALRKAEKEVFELVPEDANDVEVKLASATLCMRFLLHECGSRTPLNAPVTDLERRSGADGLPSWTLRYKNSKTNRNRHLELEQETIALILHVHALYRANIHMANAMDTESDLAPFLLMNANGGCMSGNSSGKLVMWFTQNRLGTRLSTTDIRKCIQEQLNSALYNQEISTEQFGRLNQLFLDHTAEVGIEHYSSARAVRKDPASKKLYKQVVVEELADDDSDSEP